MRRRISGIVLLCVILLIMLLWGINQRSEKLRYKSNFEAEVLHNGQQVIVTQSEYQRLYKDIDSLTRSLGLKPKQVIQIVQSNYEIVDSAVGKLTGDTIYQIRNDTVIMYIDTLKFSIDRPCYILSGYLANNQIHEKLTLKDKSSLIIYRERPRKFLFIKYGRWQYSAILHSQCSGRIMSVDNNVLIKRK